MSEKMIVFGRELGLPMTGARPWGIVALGLVVAGVGGCLLNVSGRVTPGSASEDGGPTPGDASRGFGEPIDEINDSGARRDSDITQDANIPDLSVFDPDVLDATPSDGETRDVADDSSIEDAQVDAACTPTSEECNAVDDDCNGLVDDDGCECRVETRGSSAYLFCSGETGQDMNAWDAAAYCEERGYHLVIIDSAEEGTWLMDIAFAIDNQDWGIGLNDEGEEGTWLWPDGTAPAYTNWGTDEPNGGTSENCCEVRPGTRAWNDCHCETNRPFVCEAPIP
jgi:hypothetical protein